jgi:hypothetical protein
LLGVRLLSFGWGRDCAFLVERHRYIPACIRGDAMAGSKVLVAEPVPGEDVLTPAQAGAGMDAA